MVIWSEQNNNTSQQGTQLVRSSLLQNVPNAILNNTSQTYKVAIPNQGNLSKGNQKSSMNTTGQPQNQSPRVSAGPKKPQTESKPLNSYSRSHSRIN